ncbi:MAG TPA: PDZ domain-containing protein [Thermoanaerobaculia bacterium]|jgi:S1-C subfamily serine protease|nr:PDZ domain-containing protein [Thermoanaerobaculia bacterium]
MRLTIPFCLILVALAVTFAPAAYAGGGENCDPHAKAAKTAAAGTSDRAAQLAAKGWLGIETGKDEATGAYVVKTVAPSSPASGSFRPGDVLVALNGVALNAGNKEALKKVKSGLGVGSQVTYTIKRDGATRKVTATLAPVPQDVLAKWVAEEEQHEQPVAVASKP